MGWEIGDGWFSTGLNQPGLPSRLLRSGLGMSQGQNSRHQDSQSIKLAGSRKGVKAGSRYI